MKLNSSGVHAHLSQLVSTVSIGFYQQNEHEWRTGATTAEFNADMVLLSCNNRSATFLDLPLCQSRNPWQYQTVLSSIVVFIMAALVGYKDMKPLHSSTNHKEALLSNLLVSESLFIIFTFLCTVVLMMCVFFVYQYGRRGRGWCRVLAILFWVTGMMLIVAKHNPRHHHKQKQHNSRAGFGARQCGTDGGASHFHAWQQGTVVFGYLKPNASNRGKSDPPLDLAMCYTTLTLSLIVLMIHAMPMAFLPGGKLRILVKYVEFLDGFVVSFFLETIAVVLYCAGEFFSARQSQGESSPLDSTFRNVATVGFTLMTGLCAAFLGTDHYNVYLKIAMFVLLLAVLSSLSRLAFPLHAPEMGGAMAVVAPAFPLAAPVAAIPLVLWAFLDLYLSR
ncbi:hypothetical protein ACP70R_036539 [Stipagrostis hirtigluma subsp. patula]